MTEIMSVEDFERKMFDVRGSGWHHQLNTAYRAQARALEEARAENERLRESCWCALCQIAGTEYVEDRLFVFMPCLSTGEELASYFEGLGWIEPAPKLHGRAGYWMTDKAKASLPGDAEDSTPRPCIDLEEGDGLLVDSTVHRLRHVCCTCGSEHDVIFEWRSDALVIRFAGLEVRKDAEDSTEGES